MHPADAAVLLAYLTGVVVFGAYLGGRQRTVQEYFVSGRRLPAWAIMGSIVATETSTVTFISIPGLAYATDFTFLQLVLGYLLGRVVVSAILIPAYFRGELLTAYELLGRRFGTATKRLASLVFIATRSLADGFRLFATGLVLAALLGLTAGVSGGIARLLPFASPATGLLVLAVLVIGAATVFYTYHGGMTAVIWTDVVQLVVYLTGAGVAALVLLHQIPGGWSEVVAVGDATGKFRLFDFTWDVTRGYTFWSGVVGGMFLTTATHGTDQLMVQRYLCARSVRDARAALLWSGVVILAQFALFLLIGVMLFVYYTRHAAGEMAGFTVAGQIATDRIFPQFIVQHLPVGIVGLVLAAILAAAMSTLSSSLNSSSAAAMGDFYLPWRGGGMTELGKLRVSRAFTALFGVVQIVAAIVAIRLSKRVVDEVLAVAAFTNGLVLGLFLLGTLTRRVGQRSALAGVALGATVMLVVKLGTAVSWQWYVLVGSLTTVAGGLAAAGLVPEAAPTDRRA
jgi:solute:Na+ symporter, SSS family